MMKALRGTSLAMNALRSDIALAAQAEANVLIVGETGVGKELVARAIHEQSERYDRAYVAVDCGTLTDELAASELFGYRRGSFTGATTDHQGLLASADRGTLFLDELGNLSVRVQGMLLRTVQEQQIRRLGDHHEQRIDVRVLSATNRTLDGGFRQDLLYRLNTITIHVPALREHPSDIPTLAMHFVERLNAQYQRRITLSTDAARYLQTYAYPGNVRELEHLVHRAYLKATNIIEAEQCNLPTSSTPITIVCRNFWQDVAIPLQERRITRYQVETMIRQGLQQTKGSYRKLLPGLGMDSHDYKRFMDFLRRHHCNVDYRGYRK
jgi:transcriptional regulator with GAF, ATPase, and Fis domain